MINVLSKAMQNILENIRKSAANFFTNLLYLNPMDTGKKLGLESKTSKKVTANYIGFKVTGTIVGNQKSPYTGEKYATIALDKPKKIMGSWRWHVVVKEKEITKYTT
jgi:hypothetical protein